MNIHLRHVSAFLKSGFVSITIIAVVATRSSSQQILSERDSLSIGKSKPLKSIYQVSNSVLRELSIILGSPKLASPIPKKKMGNFMGGTLTLFTGLNTYSADAGTWVIENELTCLDAAYTWRVPLYISGELIKDRERVKNEDGSTSVVTKKGIQVDWNKGAYGLILERADTLGYFTIVTNLREDTSCGRWLSKLSQEGKATMSKLKFFYPGPGYDFKVVLAFREKAFSMITNGSYFRSLILVNESPVAIFQSDPHYITLNKKNRLDPYLLLSGSVDEKNKTDLIRLAFLNILFTRCVSVNFHEM